MPGISSADDANFPPVLLYADTEEKKNLFSHTHFSFPNTVKEDKNCEGIFVTLLHNSEFSPYRNKKQTKKSPLRLSVLKFSPPTTTKLFFPTWGNTFMYIFILESKLANTCTYVEERRKRRRRKPTLHSRDRATPHESFSLIRFLFFLFFLDRPS